MPAPVRTDCVKATDCVAITARRCGSSRRRRRGDPARQATRIRRTRPRTCWRPPSRTGTRTRRPMICMPYAVPPLDPGGSGQSLTAAGVADLVGAGADVVKNPRSGSLQHMLNDHFQIVPLLCRSELLQPPGQSFPRSLCRSLEATTPLPRQGPLPEPTRTLDDRSMR